MYIKGGRKMFIVFKNRTTFDQVQLTGVKAIAFDGTTYTVTKSDNTTATYSAATFIMWSFN